MCPNALWASNGIYFANASIKPFGLFVHADNTVYGTTQGTSQAHVWSSQGGDPIRNLVTNLINPAAIFVTIDGDIYVDNGGYNRVELWKPGATVGIDVMNTSRQCMGIFIDTKNNLYCAASDNHVVLGKPLNGSSESADIVAGTLNCGAAPDELCLPNGIFVDTNSILYVADWKNNRIQKFKLGEKNGQTIAGNGSAEVTDLLGPTGVILDADGYVFIVDMNNNRVIGEGPYGFRCIVGCSKISTQLTSGFNGPRTASFDSYGNLFVSDRWNHRILKFLLQDNTCGMSIAILKTKLSNQKASDKPNFPLL